jgi:4-hydroxy 2-oxovalerate aldolase
VDFVRCATYLKDLDKAIRIVNDAHAKGYDTAINIMSISAAAERELEDGLLRIRSETRVKACYVVDSFGNLHPEDIDHFVATFQQLLPGIPRWAESWSRWECGYEIVRVPDFRQGRPGGC